MKRLKFICPHCGRETAPELVLTGAVVSIGYKVGGTDSEVYEDYPCIEEHSGDYWRCSRCHGTLPVEAESEHGFGFDMMLIDWLKRQPYNEGVEDELKE